MTIGELAMGRKWTVDSYRDYLSEIMESFNNNGEYFDGTTTRRVDKKNDNYLMTTLKPVLTGETVERVLEEQGFIPKREYND